MENNMPDFPQVSCQLRVYLLTARATAHPWPCYLFRRRPVLRRIGNYASSHVVPNQYPNRTCRSLLFPEPFRWRALCL
jgi:hypothetical protein